MHPGAAGDASRWSDALSLLGDHPTQRAHRRVRRRRRLVRILLALAVLLLLGALMIVLVVLLPDLRSRPLDGPALQVGAALVLGAASLVLVAVGVSMTWWRVRRLGGLRNPVLALDRAQRRELFAQVRGLRPADPSLLPLTSNLAGRMIGQRWLLLAVLGVWLSMLGQWATRPTPWNAATSAGTTILFGVVWVLSERDVRRARRFLAAHG